MIVVIIYWCRIHKHVTLHASDANYKILQNCYKQLLLKNFKLLQFLKSGGNLIQLLATMSWNVPLCSGISRRCVVLERRPSLCVGRFNSKYGGQFFSCMVWKWFWVIFALKIPFPNHTIASWVEKRDLQNQNREKRSGRPAKHSAGLTSFPGYFALLAQCQQVGHGIGIWTV